MMQTPSRYALDSLQKTATALLVGLLCVTFVASNALALLWQSSDWLVATVLPAVVVDLTNEERGAIEPLVRSSLLDQAAAAKARHMAAEGYFAHFAPDGTTPWDFFDQVEYTYAHAGENLAIHFADSAEVVEAWMNSPAHRENIVNPQFSEIGVGTARGTYEGYETVFVVQLFGTPAVSVTPDPVQTPVTAVEPLATTEPFADESIEPAAVAPVVEEGVETVTLAELVEQANALEDRVAALTEPAMPAPVALGVDTNPVALQIDTVTPKQQLDAVSETTLSYGDDAAKKQLTDVLPTPIYRAKTEMATSSGLAAAPSSNPVEVVTTGSVADQAATIMTRPQLLMQIVYGAVVVTVIVLLGVALVRETRQMHYVQVAYSLLLIAVASGLWYAHVLLTSGAIIA